MGNSTDQYWPQGCGLAFLHTSPQVGITRSDSNLYVNKEIGWGAWPLVPGWTMHTIGMEIKVPEMGSGISLMSPIFVCRWSEKVYTVSTVPEWVSEVEEKRFVSRWPMGKRLSNGYYRKRGDKEWPVKLWNGLQPISRQWWTMGWVKEDYIWAQPVGCIQNMVEIPFIYCVSTMWRVSWDQLQSSCTDDLRYIWIAETSFCLNK